MAMHKKISPPLEPCSCCGIPRNHIPKPGTCPCCFYPMTSFNTGHCMIYTCRNRRCKRVVTSSYLSGFWSGWREREKVIDERSSNGKE